MENNTIKAIALGANQGLETGNVEENISILKNVVDTYKKILM